MYEDIRGILLANATLVAAVALNPKSADRCIRPLRLHQSDVLPAIEILIDDEVGQNDLVSHGGTVNASVAICCIANSAAAAAALARKTVAAVESCAGATANGTVQSVTYLDTKHGYAPYEDGSDGGEYVAEVQLKVWFVWG